MLARTLFLTFHGIGEPVTKLSAGEEGYFVTVDTYRRTIDALEEFESNSGNQICITFDDGNLSDYQVGVPALLDVGRTGHFFVLAGRIGQQGYLSGKHIRDMVASGMTIGSHGWKHVDWRKLNHAGRKQELYDARRKIEDVAGIGVTEAAIPFGLFDRRVLAALKEGGYGKVSTSTAGLCYDNAWFRPRWSVKQDFDPKLDLPQRLSVKQICKGTAYAQLRRLRYFV